MAVTDPNIVDLIGVDDAKNSVSLGVSDHLPWDDQVNEQHLLALQEKINAYLRFIESGEIYSVYPKSVGRQIEIEIVLKNPPDASGLEFLEKARQAIRDSGVTLHWKVV